VYDSLLIFDENKSHVLSFMQAVVGVLKTVCSLQLSIEHGKDDQSRQLAHKEILEVALPLESDPLIAKFARMTNVGPITKSILEIVLEMMLQFWELTDRHPWVIQSSVTNVYQEIQEEILEGVHRLVKQITSVDSQKVSLPVLLLCQVYLSRKHPLETKSVQQAC
jgi:hypothetical protein